jgi:hypothetical protein
MAGRQPYADSRTRPRTCQNPMPPRREDGTTSWIDSWESYAEQRVREAIERGEFGNLPGSGKPLTLDDDNPFEGEMGPTFRLAHNAGVAPRWITIGQDVEASLATLDALLQAVPHAPNRAPEPSGATRNRGWWAWVKRVWCGPPRTARLRTRTPPVDARAVARARFLERAAHADELICAFNAQLPRGLAWLERPRLTPTMAAERFDRAWPPGGDGHA